MAERVPVRLVLPLIPEPDSIGDGEVRFRTMHTPEVTVARAISSARKMSEKFRQSYERGDLEAPVRLLEINLAFIAELWVQEALRSLFESGYVRLTKDGRLRCTGRGRPRGSSRLGDMVVVGLIERLTAELGSPRAAFRRAEEWTGLSFDRLERRYRAVLRDGRLAPLLFEVGPAEAERAPDSEVRPRELLPGMEVAYPDIPSPFGPGTLTIRAGEPSPQNGKGLGEPWTCASCGKQGYDGPRYRCPKCQARL